ncbi:VWA-like domain-containing protein [Paraburkholderia sp. BCC1876]|uniref:vWA domain-containing protein n=1 Tax=Paraburkholderia sp. BCC1876 TaxID=2676303 RepID=UPI001590984A|nr:VWA-like domain-containing protein [Paraburkholderia sp. BCC1876]
MDPRISKQRTALVLDQPFFGALALRLKVVEDPSCDTFWVDGVSLGYNPAYAATLNDLELRGALAQKVLQVANGHCWRMGSRDQKQWDDASAEAVNPIVKDAGMLLPAGAVLTPRFKGKSAEEIYAHLAREARQKEKGGKDGNGGAKPGNTGRPQPANGANTSSAAPPPHAVPSGGEVRQYRGEDVAVKEAEWKVAVLQAAKAAQMRGSLPGGLQAMATQAVEPVVDWRAILHRFAQQSAPTDYSFAMPNRRYLHMGLYLPSLNEPAVGDAVFVRDTSGTVFDETQSQFAAEIMAVNDSVRPRRLIVMDCDTRVTQVQMFERGEPVELLPAKGGGGTVFVEPFRRLLEEEIQPAFLVYLTDMDGRFPDEAPSYPVLWASTTPLRRARKAPFGETVEVIC